MPAASTAEAHEPKILRAAQVRDFGAFDEARGSPCRRRPWISATIVAASQVGRLNTRFALKEIPASERARTQLPTYFIAAMTTSLRPALTSALLDICWPERWSSRISRRTRSRDHAWRRAGGPRRRGAFRAHAMSRQ